MYAASLAPFLSFYALFAAVLYPFSAHIHPTHLLATLKTALPQGAWAGCTRSAGVGLRTGNPCAMPLAPRLLCAHCVCPARARAGLVGLAGMLVHWSFSLFFIMGELWGGVAISLLFWWVRGATHEAGHTRVRACMLSCTGHTLCAWLHAMHVRARTCARTGARACRGLAAEVCTLREASEVYPLLGIIANVGLVLGGGWIKTVNATLSGARQACAHMCLHARALGAASHATFDACQPSQRWCHCPPAAPPAPHAAPRTLRRHTHCAHHPWPPA